MYGPASPPDVTWSGLSVVVSIISPSWIVPSSNTSRSLYCRRSAAVSKAEDAAALVDALKKKQYPAFSTNTPTDKLIHVQVGPYADIKDAELMRGKLVSDGYNPILKR